MRKKLFGLFCPSGLSILTSSHFQEEGLAESWLQLNPFYAVSLKDWKVTIPIKQLVFSSPARLQGNHIKLKKNTTQSLVFHLIFHTNLRSDCGLATSEVLVTQKKLHTRQLLWIWLPHYLTIKEDASKMVVEKEFSAMVYFEGCTNSSKKLVFISYGL